MPRCRFCKSTFEAKNSLNRLCSPKCAYAWLMTEEGQKQHRKVKAKIQREKINAKKEALKTKGDWTKELQKVFNEFIRLRDRDEECISCDASNATLAEKWKGGKWDAGHYRSTGSAPHLRFNEANAAKQCKKCNNQLSGNIVEYRKKLIKRIGVEAVEALEANQEPLRLTVEDIKAMLKEYRAKVRQLKREASE